MDESPITLNSLIGTLLFSVFSLVFIFTFFANNRNSVVFCDVGQGNATYIRNVPDIDIIVDAGQDARVLECLGRHMPFFDRKVELLIITHPDSDHYGGAIHIINRFKVNNVITSSRTEGDAGYAKLLSRIDELNIRRRSYFSGDKIRLGSSVFTFYWPPVDFLNVKDNDASSIFLYEKSGFRLLFTGDSIPETLNSLTYRDKESVDILMVPHHGSRNGLTEKFLRLADPVIAVISAGKNNPYGHPHNSIIDLLKAKNIKIKRTDEDGDIKINLEE